MIFLLDVNLLFILHQPRHADYEVVSKWLRREKNMRFATCAMTQAGMMRLLVQDLPGFSRFSFEEARAAMQQLVKRPGHVYWTEAPAYLEITAEFLERLQGHRQITDAYLLGLARHHGGKLATLDKGIKSIAGPHLEAFVELVA